MTRIETDLVLIFRQAIASDHNVVFPPSQTSWQQRSNNALIACTDKVKLAINVSLRAGAKGLALQQNKGKQKATFLHSKRESYRCAVKAIWPNNSNEHTVLRLKRKRHRSKSALVSGLEARREPSAIFCGLLLRSRSSDRFDPREFTIAPQSRDRRSTHPWQPCLSLASRCQTLSTFARSACSARGRSCPRRPENNPFRPQPETAIIKQLQLHHLAC